VLRAAIMEGLRGLRPVAVASIVAFIAVPILSIRDQGSQVIPNVRLLVVPRRGRAQKSRGTILGKAVPRLDRLGRVLGDGK